MIMDLPKGKDFGTSPVQEVTRAEEAQLYNKLPEKEKKYALLPMGLIALWESIRAWH